MCLFTERGCSFKSLLMISDDACQVRVFVVVVVLV